VHLLEHFDLGSDDLVKVVCVVDMAVPLAVDIYGVISPKPQLSKTQHASTRLRWSLKRSRRCKLNLKTLK
jgi:hypothetical protein